MESMIEAIGKHLEESILTKQRILKNEKIQNSVKEAVELITKAYSNGNKTLIAGNGGSAADAQHIAGEFVSRFYFDRPGLSSVALSTDTSILTAIGNDYGFEKIFSRQVQANGEKGDVFIGITTSGQSKNILNAVDECKKRNIKTIILTGNNPSHIKDEVDICINVPSDSTPRIQESHILIGHIICALVEESIFTEK